VKPIKLIYVTLAIGFSVAAIWYIEARSAFRKKFMSTCIEKIEDLVNLLPKTTQEIEKRTQLYLEQAQEDLNTIIGVPTQMRNFENTMLPIDRLVGFSNAKVWGQVLGLYEQTHPDKEIRTAAHNGLIRIKTFFNDQFIGNKTIFKALMDYDAIKHEKDILDEEQTYVTQEFIDDFLRSGISLPEHIFSKICILRQEIDELLLAFERTISEDNSFLQLNDHELQGIDSKWIAHLKRDDTGACIVGIDYPTYQTIMDNCSVEATRKKLYFLFSNRGYPANDVILRKIIAKRHEIAVLIGFDSYAHLDLDSQMAKTPAIVERFLLELISRSALKEERELALWCGSLPEGATYSADKKIKLWDLAYIRNNCKKRRLQIDEYELCKYFPLENTLQKFLDIYRSFMHIEFEELFCEGLWHKDVRMLAVYNQCRTEILGYIFLDLHPRENKYSHAACFPLIPAIYCDELLSERIPAVVAVVANLAPPQLNDPSLLMLSEVKTLFHEFGHALHSVLGATHMSVLSGTSVKCDFVEMPSQLLEEWLWDEEILTKISCHYKTGAPLPYRLIKKITASKHFDSGSFVQRQACLALYSLNLFNGITDPQELEKDLHCKYRDAFDYEPNVHFYASFGHLTGYGAKYYSYLWSKVFALDLFGEIKRYGLYDRNIGQRYVQEVLAFGGSRDPNKLVENFLGRPPEQSAFLIDLGLTTQQHIE